MAVGLWLAANRTPSGCHFIVTNETGGPLRNVRMVFPWGEYTVKAIGPTTYLPFHHHLCARPLNPLADNSFIFSYEDKDGKRRSQQPLSVYYEDQPVILTITVRKDGSINIVEKHPLW